MEVNNKEYPVGYRKELPCTAGGTGRRDVEGKRDKFSGK